jgi:hypothetical protein
MQPDISSVHIIWTMDLYLWEVNNNAKEIRKQIKMRLWKSITKLE